MSPSIRALCFPEWMNRMSSSSSAPSVPPIDTPILVAWGLVLLLVALFVGFATTGGDFGYHVETHQIIGTAVVAGAALFGGWLRIPRNYLVAAGLFGF